MGTTPRIQAPTRQGCVAAQRITAKCEQPALEGELLRTAVVPGAVVRWGDLLAPDCCPLRKARFRNRALLGSGGYAQSSGGKADRWESRARPARSGRRLRRPGTPHKLVESWRVCRAGERPTNWSQTLTGPAGGSSTGPPAKPSPSETAVAVQASTHTLRQPPAGEQLADLANPRRRVLRSSGGGVPGPVGRCPARRRAARSVPARPALNGTLGIRALGATRSAFSGHRVRGSPPVVCRAVMPAKQQYAQQGADHVALRASRCWARPCEIRRVCRRGGPSADIRRRWAAGSACRPSPARRGPPVTEGRRTRSSADLPAMNGRRPEHE